ncbi:DUF2357 domain-containing protein [Yersinia enterocolitica]
MRRGTEAAEWAHDIDSVESLYLALSESGVVGAQARVMLMLRSWLMAVLHFDPVTGLVQPTGMIDFMNRVGSTMRCSRTAEVTQDRVYRIVSHTDEAILSIMAHSRDKIVREHTLLPLHAAREVDSVTVQWLSRQPGITLREKLAGSAKIKAARRKTSVDTSENRLLKAFLFRLEQLLFDRQNALDVAIESRCEALLVAIQRWLRSASSAEIGAWGNFPPNNTLLQDKRYRKIWDGWLWLQQLDENILRDRVNTGRDMMQMVYWQTLASLHQSGRFRTCQQPLEADYDDFSLSPSMPVRGFWFPETSSVEVAGTIDRLVSEKKFGFISGIFFHASDLKKGLRFDTLKPGDSLLFVVEDSPKGKCAKQLRLGTLQPRELELIVDDHRMLIRLAGCTVSIEVDGMAIQVVDAGRNIRQVFPFTPESVPAVQQAILSLAFDCEPAGGRAKSDIQEPMAKSIVDLCTTRPQFTTHSGSQECLPFRLLRQRWPSTTQGVVDVDCGETKAIVLRDGLETVSMRSLFSPQNLLTRAASHSTALFFTQKLKQYLPAKTLTYLVPDWGNDFALESIRKSINFYFEDSAPLPKSIAAIFAWQSSRKFAQQPCRAGDIVLVIDAFEGGCSITPVQAVYQQAQASLLPASQGISWERHPTVVIENRATHDALCRNLEQDGCPSPEMLVHLFGFDGLVDDAGSVSFVKDEQWYHLPRDAREMLKKNVEAGLFTDDQVNTILSSIKHRADDTSLFILPLADTLKKPALRAHYRWLGSAWSAIKGCQTLNEWQQQAAGAALWCDHLPQLSIRLVRDGRYENFYLVKDATVTPQRGLAVNIPVVETFTLPKGQTHYRFPLQQGAGHQQLQFVAFLKSPAFPLLQDTRCALKMTYTYGADDPYALEFTPLDATIAGFKSLDVDWRQASEDMAALPAPVPGFPQVSGWTDFLRYPNKQGDGTKDLLEWCCSTLAGLDDFFHFDREQELQAAISKRAVGVFVWGSHDKNGNYYCRVKVGNDTIFCHSSKFLETIDVANLREGYPVYIDICTHGDKPYGDNISFTERLPAVLEQQLRADIQQRFTRMVKGVSSMRFPVFTIWNHGRSLGELDAPESFRNTLSKGIDNAVKIVEDPAMDSTLREELFFLLSCLQGDAPPLVASRLLDAIKEKNAFWRRRKYIAYALGSARFDWQQTLLENVVNPDFNDSRTRLATLEILSIALWRSKSLIDRLAVKEIIGISRALFAALENDYQRLNEPTYSMVTLAKHLELVLALLRSRGREVDELNTAFSPANQHIKAYISLIDSITHRVIDYGLPLPSRLNLEIAKPEAFSKTPDLLFALHMYLTGDSGANVITITGVDED